MSITTIIDLYRLARNRDFNMGVVRAVVWAVHVDYLAWQWARAMRKEDREREETP